MARPQLHSTEVVLDAARDLVVQSGPRAVGIRDIAKLSGAPSGSLYHRFKSRDELIARAWLRAVRRFQSGFLEALAKPDPGDAAPAAARWGVEFALANPADARMLLDHGRSDLLDGELEGEIAAELAAVNAPIERAGVELAERAFGELSAATLERVTYAVIDLPLAVVRRHLIAGTLGEPAARSLEAAVRMLLNHDDEERT